MVPSELIRVPGNPFPGSQVTVEAISLTEYTEETKYHGVSESL
jgi:hypothetical protein